MPVHRIRFYFIRRNQLQQIPHRSSGELWIQPFLVVRRPDNGGHAIVNGLENFVGSRRDDRAGFNLVRIRVQFRLLPQSREGEGAIVLEADEIGLLGFLVGLRLLFIKAIGGDQAAPPVERGAEHAADRQHLDSRVDRPKLGPCFGPGWNETPSRQVQNAFPLLVDSRHRDELRRRDVISHLLGKLLEWNRRGRLDHGANEADSTKGKASALIADCIPSLRAALVDGPADLFYKRDSGGEHVRRIAGCH